MKQKIKKCENYKCPKSFVLGIRSKYCCDECAQEALELTKRSRRLNIKYNERLEQC